MLDQRAAEGVDRVFAAPWPAMPDGGRGRRRVRALLVCVTVAAFFHWRVLDSIGSGVPAAPREPAVTPLSTRTIAAPVPSGPAAPVTEAAGAEDIPAVVTVSTVDAAATPREATAAPIAIVARPSATSDGARGARPRRPAAADGAEGTRATVDLAARASNAARASTVEGETPIGPAAQATPSETPIGLAAQATLSEASLALALAAPAPSASAAEAPRSERAPAPMASVETFLAGSEPPPLYRTRLPPAATLHYQVRRGMFSGTGDIRWQPSGQSYRIALEARIAGLTLLRQTSEGEIDAHGLRPTRFLDQRARRAAQAANFRRDVGRISYSGTNVEWPLLQGSQDRLSWMIQIAGIAAAQPERLVAGAQVIMVVAGARGDADVWTLRCTGPDTLETAWGTVHAIRLVRDGRSTYDTRAEVWLDPERGYLPARATLGNSTSPEYDLLLERIDPG